MIQPHGYEPTVQTDLAVGFLRQQALEAEQPFCLALSWGPPHDPYDQVPAQFRSRYRPEDVILRPNAEPDAPNPLAAKLRCRETMADYYAAISALDHELGRLLSTLDELSLADHTLVIFTSDHGDMLWSHGLMKKQSPYEESIVVPFIARWPGHLVAGSVSDLLLATVDIAPTLAGFCGWPAPSEWRGQDLSALLTGAPGDWPEAVLISNPVSHDEALAQDMPEWRGLRTARHTYVETVLRTPWLLFDNQADPYQMTNLIGQAQAAPLQQHLSLVLGRWLEKAQDSFLPGTELLEHCGVGTLWRERALHFYGPKHQEL